MAYLQTNLPNMQQNQRAEVIEQYMNRYKDEDFKNKTLARIIVQENPGIFEQTEKEIDGVRALIRYRRGAMGDKLRNLARPEFVRDVTKPGDFIKNYVTYKPPRERVWKLPEEIKRVLTMSDIHVPYHHLPSIEVTLNHAFKRGIDAIYLNGDLMDFTKISRWRKPPSTHTPQVEIDGIRSFLEGLSDLGVKVFYKMGNHEDRWEHYLWQQAPEISEIDAVQFANVLATKELGIEIIHSLDRAEFGHLSVVHGHEFGQSVFSPVNPARGLFLRAKSSTLSGHYHQTSSHHENNLSGKATACFSTGCLSDLSPDYRPFGYTKWNHGAAIVSVYEDKNFSVENFRILDGRVRG
jgi:predicted phosphodiesterase